MNKILRRASGLTLQARPHRTYDRVRAVLIRCGMAHATHALLAVVAALHVGCASSAPEEEPAAATVTERRTLLAAVRTDDGVYHLRLSGRRGAVRLPVDPSATAPVGSMTLGPLPAGTPVKVEHVRWGRQPLFGLDGPPRLSAGTDGEVYLVGDGQLTRLMALPFDEPGAPHRGPKQERGKDSGADTPSLAGGVFQFVSGLGTVAEAVGLLISIPFMALALFAL